MTSSIGGCFHGMTDTIAFPVLQTCRWGLRIALLGGQLLPEHVPGR
jgi:hypothetical protein